MSDIRPVWPTREQRDAVQIALESAAMPLGDAIEKPIEELLAAWDAAPADAAEAAILGTMLPNYTENDRAFVTPIVLNVLRALGMPDA